MLPGGTAHNLHDLTHLYRGLDLYYAGAAQPLTTAGEELDGLDHDLSDLSVLHDLDHDIFDLSVLDDLDHDLSDLSVLYYLDHELSHLSVLDDLDHDLSDLCPR